jgi:hypothetical protein
VTEEAIIRRVLGLKELVKERHPSFFGDRAAIVAVAAAAAAVARRGLAAAPGAKWLEGPALAAWQLASVDAHVVQPRWVAATCATHSPACISHDSVRFHGDAGVLLCAGAASRFVPLPATASCSRSTSEKVGMPLCVL